MLAKYDGCWQYPIDRNHHVIVDTGLAIDCQLGAVMRYLTTTALYVIVPSWRKFVRQLIHR